MTDRRAAAACPDVPKQSRAALGVSTRVWGVPVQVWGMTLVLLVAAALRLVALPDLPLGLHYDEAANLILTRQIVSGDYHPLFIRAYTGKEVLFFYAAAPWVWMTGGEAWGLRLGAAMLGVLTVAATFAAVRALFGRSRQGLSVALLAAGWMALAFPHVLLSRYGFRAIAQPLFQALTVAALWRGLRTGRVRWLIGAGLCLGLTGYTYLAARLFPIPLALALAWLLVRTAPRQRRQLSGRLGIVLGAAAIAFAPLGLYFLHNPQAFTTRIAQVAAPSLAEALRGIVACLQALVWPGRGDPYVRFNAPGLPVLDPVSAFLAVVGLVVLLRARVRSPWQRAGRLLPLLATGVMLLPSALATGEITPSNLRMVGLYPFLAVLPGWGLYAVLGLLRDGRARLALFAALLIGGAGYTGVTYTRWAGSDALFRAADGDMVLAAQALDTLAVQDPAPTVYIASTHYRHPTVAALAAHYPEAKWLTGGATLVLPAQGEAAYLIPEGLRPPAPWPDAVTGAWTTASIPGPAGTHALTVARLTTGQIRDLRASMTTGDTEQGSAADFAHVVRLHNAELPLACRVSEECPALVVWEPLAPYPQLQPVVRLFQPETGEWSRTMAFHYPAEQWTPGDVVLDQLVLTPPVGTPPGDGYRLGVGFYDPGSSQALPRLIDERFAGLEASFPAGHGFTLLPAAAPPGEQAAACSGISSAHSGTAVGLTALGWVGVPDDPVPPGSALTLRVCWQAPGAMLDPPPVQLSLQSDPADGESVLLYAGALAPGYGPASWRAGEVVEARYAVRIPRDLAPATYHLVLAPGSEAGASQAHVARALELGAVTVLPLARDFDLPTMDVPVGADFAAGSDPELRLLGYDLSQAGGPGARSGELDPAAPLTVTLYWQALSEMDRDYVVFLHLRADAASENAVQDDRAPQDGAYPTSLWLPDEVVADTHTLSLPADLAPGAYDLTVGLYVPLTGAQLWVDGDWQVHLATLTVLP